MSLLFLLALVLGCLRQRVLSLSTNEYLPDNASECPNTQALGTLTIESGTRTNSGGNDDENLQTRLPRLYAAERPSVVASNLSWPHDPCMTTAPLKSTSSSPPNTSTAVIRRQFFKHRALRNTTFPAFTTSSTSLIDSMNLSDFNPMARGNVAVYYGQSDMTTQVPLSTVCDDQNVDIIILAFVISSFTPGGWPTLNLGTLCSSATTAQLQAGAEGLLDCTSNSFSTLISQCQANGKKILVSLGGAIAKFEITDDNLAEELAQTIWNLFLGGTNNSTTNGLRPFGVGVILDGIDIDNESGSMGSLSRFIATLRGLFMTNDQKKYFLSAAPQCPRPDASIPLLSMQSSIDFIWVQFYNNPSCNLDTEQDFITSLKSWSRDLSNASISSSRFTNVGNGVSNPRLFIGVPTFADAGSGFVDESQFRSIMESVLTANIDNLGGVMFWDAAYGERNTAGGVSFMQIAKNVFD